jgi:hypothetical protein
MGGLSSGTPGVTTGISGFVISGFRTTSGPPHEANMIAKISAMTTMTQVVLYLITLINLGS